MLTADGNVTAASLFDVSGGGVFTSGGGVGNAGAGYFDAISAADLTSVGLVTAKSGMVINMSNVGTSIQKGDILELSITNSSGTTSDQVIVAGIREDMDGITNAISEDPGADVDVPSEAPEPTEDDLENEMEEILADQQATEDEMVGEVVDEDDPVVFEETRIEDEEMPL